MHHEMDYGSAIEPDVSVGELTLTSMTTFLTRGIVVGQRLGIPRIVSLVASGTALLF